MKAAVLSLVSAEVNAGFIHGFALLPKCIDLQRCLKRYFAEFAEAIQLAFESNGALFAGSFLVNRWV